MSGSQKIDCPVCLNDLSTIRKKIWCPHSVNSANEFTHGICMECALKLAENSTSIILCPICRKQLHLPDSRSLVARIAPYIALGTISVAPPMMIGAVVGYPSSVTKEAIRGVVAHEGFMFLTAASGLIGLAVGYVMSTTMEMMLSRILFGQPIRSTVATTSVNTDRFLFSIRSAANLVVNNDNTQQQQQQQQHQQQQLQHNRRDEQQDSDLRTRQQHLIETLRELNETYNAISLRTQAGGNNSDSSDSSDSDVDLNTSIVQSEGHTDSDRAEGSVLSSMADMNLFTSDLDTEDTVSEHSNESNDADDGIHVVLGSDHLQNITQPQPQPQQLQQQLQEQASPQQQSLLLRVFKKCMLGFKVVCCAAGCAIAATKLPSTALNSLPFCSPRSPSLQFILEIVCESSHVVAQYVYHLLQKRIPNNDARNRLSRFLSRMNIIGRICGPVIGCLLYTEVIQPLVARSSSPALLRGHNMFVLYSLQLAKAAAKIFPPHSLPQFSSDAIKYFV